MKVSILREVLEPRLQPRLALLRVADEPSEPPPTWPPFRPAD